MVVRKVAVTGGIACGKSTVCQLFRNLGALVVSADQIVHQLLSHDQDVKLKVIELLGLSVLENGVLQRNKIASSVFGHPDKLKKLEMILFPKVLAAIVEAYENTPESTILFVAEVPLLFEAGFEEYFDTTIAVVADEAVVEKRLPSFKQRAEYQMDNQEKARRADYIIVNNGTLQELNNEVKQCTQSILQGD